MNHRNSLSQLDKWEAVLHRGEPLDHLSLANDPSAELPKEQGSEVIVITDLEVFLNEMSNAD